MIVTQAHRKTASPGLPEALLEQLVPRLRLETGRIAGFAGGVRGRAVAEQWVTRRSLVTR